MEGRANLGLAFMVFYFPRLLFSGKDGCFVLCPSARRGFSLQRAEECLEFRNRDRMRFFALNPANDTHFHSYPQSHHSSRWSRDSVSLGYETCEAMEDVEITYGSVSQIQRTEGRWAQQGERKVECGVGLNNEDEYPSFSTTLYIAQISTRSPFGPEQCSRAELRLRRKPRREDAPMSMAWTHVYSVLYVLKSALLSPQLVTSTPLRLSHC
jgi:hypothetical protein